MVQEPWLPEQWDAEADVVVVGFGAAGAATAITAHDLGASVIMLEKAPEGEEGGNTRVAVQGYLNVTDVEQAIEYLDALSGPFAVPPEMVRAWAEEMSKNNEWLASIGGDPHEYPLPTGDARPSEPGPGASQAVSPGVEFPELPGSASVHKFHHGEILGYSQTWLCFERAVRERSIDIRYEAPGRELIQHGVTKEILGVRAEHDGAPFYVKARKAVVLTCGGFENNQEMIRTYLPGVPECYPQGSPYNEGDGISMALTVGRRPLAHEQLRGAVDGAQGSRISDELLHDRPALRPRTARRDGRRGSGREALHGREAANQPREGEAERVVGSAADPAPDVHGLRPRAAHRRSALRQGAE